MTKFLVGALVAGAVVCSGSIRAQGDSRDLWIGTITYDAFEGQSTRSQYRLSENLEPIAALVDGKWWFEDKADPDGPHAELDKVPAQWLPTGKDLPTTWHARLFDGRRAALRIAGALHVSGIFDHHVFASDLELPPLGPEDSDYGAKGVAFAGAVDVRLFENLPDGKRTQLLRFLTPGMLKAMRANIAARAADDTADDFVKATAQLPLGRLAAAPFEIATAKTAVQRDGLAVFFIEGETTLGIDGICHATRTGGAARRDRTGTLRMLGAWSELVCDELYIGHEPLALFERDSTSCWLVAHQYEDGLEFLLSTSQRIEEERSACGIK